MLQALRGRPLVEETCGTLHFKGRNYPFTINGLGVGGLGVSKLEATGEVYRLDRISDLDGVYGQVRVGWALADQGTGRLWLENDKGVVLRLRTRRQGLMLAVGADAVRIRSVPSPCRQHANWSKSYQFSCSTFDPRTVLHSSGLRCRSTGSHSCRPEACSGVAGIALDLGNGSARLVGVGTRKPPTRS
jgi:hypothetical protein